MVARSNAAYGRGVVEISGWYEGADILEELRSTFRSPDYVAPKIPRVAQEILALSQNPNVSLREIGRAMEKDAVLCGDVLRVAESAAFGGRGQLRSITQALCRLGVGTLRDIVVQVVMKAKVFRAKPYQRTMDRLCIHSTAVAHASRIVCRYTALDAEYAFMCGLLHDVGKAGALIALAETNRRSPPPLADVWHAVDEVHEEASKIMVEGWGLPAEVAMVVGAHHTVRVEGFAHPVAAAVRLADRIANNRGLGVGGSPTNTQYGEMSTDGLLEVLDLRPEQLELIEAEFVSSLSK